MKHEIIRCIDNAYRDTLFFASMIQSHPHIDSCVRAEMKPHVASVLARKSEGGTLNFDNGV